MFVSDIHGRKRLIARAFCITCTVLFFAAIVSAQSNPEGHWEGTLRVNNNDIVLSLDLAKNAKSEWIGSMGVPLDKAMGLVVMDLKVSGDSIKFTAVELMMAKVDLILGTDGKMKGTLASPQAPPAPIEFKRTGEARVELIPPSPAVAKEFEGDWEGSLQTPGRAFRLIFHFRNQSDHTVAATIDSPDGNGSGSGMPLNDVKQVGRQIEFGVKIAHAEFKGTLNEDSTEIVGQFGHEKEFTQLTLKKK